MFVEVNGRLMNTAAFGAGPRTLLTFGTWVFGWEAWQCQLELLSRSWQTLAFDQRGCGESSAEPADITLDNLVDDIFGVMDACAVSRSVLAVESSSAIIGLHAVLQRPERFDGLILAAGTPALPAEAGDDQPGTPQELQAALSSFIAACIPAPEHAHLRRWLEHISSRCAPAQAAQLMRAVAGHNLTARLTDVAVPTLVMHGSSDAIVPVDIARDMAARIPHSQLYIIDGGDHVPIISRPREVASRIDAFLHAL